MYQGLSLDQAPPFSAPLRFFLTAPLFMVAIGILLMLFDPTLALTRHSLESIVLIHALALGFASMVMVGALTQMLPVLAGVKYPKALEFATLVHFAFLIGIALFLYGYYFYQPEFILVASLLLLLSLGVFAVTTLVLLLKARAATATIWAMRLSTLAFLLTILLGAHLLASHGLGTMGERHGVLAVMHLSAGGIGWMLLLIIGVAFQVVPMFWVTSVFSSFCQKFVVPLSFGLVLLIALDQTALAMLPGWLLGILLFIPMGSFSLTTIRKLRTRKRKLPDVAINYWMLSMVSLLASGIVLIAHHAIGINLESPLFILFGFGFVASVITGMLYKIVPFLAWFHLTSQGIMEVPTIREMIPQTRIQWQWRLYLGALTLLLLSPLLTELLKPAGLLLSLSYGLLFWNLAKAASIYFKMGRTYAV